MLKYTYDHSFYGARSDEYQHLMTDSPVASPAVAHRREAVDPVAGRVRPVQHHDAVALEVRHGLWARGQVLGWPKGCELARAFLWEYSVSS